ncbi:MAG: phosphate ABC transporter ATP-binding protein [Archaeoglobaceae archaeon]|nr:phosphate ABC transporter ATP-binding protein [Archaeoglobaceae archaeon]MCX8152378.1 phosphate ABC transporter ATP-binding protein [Archaeoglobaceae archaeon]MDW8013718.1 phosphate ABC transporter ATP-binding protein [Archaeoglobaceae archaeon]
MNAFEVRNLRVSYDDFEIISGIDLDIPAKTCFAIMGPSGCGKSTLLRTFNRLIEINENARVSGIIKLFGKNIFEIETSELRRRVGMVFQIPNPFPHLSVYENVAVGPKFNKMVKNKKELDKIVEWALKKAVLWDEVKDRLRERASNLSGGQMQRLCIARALALKPEVLLMDEPTANLDPISASKIEELIHELKKEYTMVIVTHSPSQASRIADYVAFLYLGKIVEIGRVEDVFENPKHELTEKYLTGRIG